MRMRTALPAYAERRTRMAARGLPENVALFGPDCPWFIPLDKMRRDIEGAGQSFLSFGHYDYLGLARHPRVLAAACAAVEEHGVGAGASRLIGGERSIHRMFERELSHFLGFEATLLMGAGYLGPYSLIPHLVGPDDLIVMDELAHSSSVHGAKASRATVKTFRHNDLDDLASILSAARDTHGFALIIVEGLYSMDGDIVDLPRLLEIRDHFESWLMVDEAHSIGVLGEAGRGLCEHFGEDPRRIDILIGTLSKTFVAQGGFVCARREVIDWLKYTLPGFVFSVGLSPVIVETGRAALALLREEPERVRRLAELSGDFVARLAKAGFSTREVGARAIVPLLFDRSEKTARVSRQLSLAGIYVPPIMQTGLHSGAPRLRFFLSAEHEMRDIERVLAVLKTADAA